MRIFVLATIVVLGGVSIYASILAGHWNAPPPDPSNPPSAEPNISFDSPTTTTTTTADDDGDDATTVPVVGRDSQISSLLTIDLSATTDPLSPAYETHTERLLGRLPCGFSPAADAVALEGYESARREWCLESAKFTTKSKGEKQKSDGSESDIFDDQSGDGYRCLAAVMTVADNDDVFRVSQSFSTIPKVLPRVLSAGGAMKERDAAWDLGTVCYLNARWVAQILGAADPDRPGSPPGVEAVSGGPIEIAREIERSPLRSASSPLEAFYVSLPVVDPLWNVTESKSRGMPFFFYHTHFFVVMELSPGRYTLVAGFKSHYRVVDWMKGVASPAVLAGGRTFGRRGLEALMRDLDDFDRDIRHAWTPRINRIHHALFGTNKFRDMELSANHTPGSLRARFPGGVPVKWNESTRVRVHRFPMQSGEGCESSARLLRHRHFRNPSKPATPFVYRCPDGADGNTGAGLGGEDLGQDMTSLEDKDSIPPSRFWRPGCI